MSLLFMNGSQSRARWFAFSPRDQAYKVRRESRNSKRVIKILLANCILTNDINEVVSDAIEGYEPTHDIYEAIARGAIPLASQHAANPITHYLIPILANPSHAPFGNSSTAA